MRRLIFAVLIAACIATPLSYAKSPRQTQAYQNQEAEEADLTNHGHYQLRSVQGFVTSNGLTP